MSKRHMWGTPVSKKTNASTVNVFIKLRKAEDDASIIKSGSNTITTNPPDGSEPKTWEYTKVFGDDDEDFFDVVAKPMLDPFVEGLKDGLIFTYGVTGAGKTYTMEGAKEDGVVFKTFEYVFKKIQYDDINTISISIIELYGEELRDLLASGRRLKIQSDALKGETRVEVQSPTEAARLYKKAKAKRTTLETNCNDSSSRGHLVLTLSLEKRSADGHRRSQMCLVDLAGSERTKISGVSGSGLEETKSINKSLFVLRKCIKDLKEDKFRCAYRETNLTKLFKSYFDGKGAVTLILCINPQRDSYSQNLFAMEFGAETRDVKVDYGSPPKQSKRSEGFLESNLNFGAALQLAIAKSKERKALNKREFETFQLFEKKVRGSICELVNENSKFKQREDVLSKQLKTREDIILRLESENDKLSSSYDSTRTKLKNENEELKSRLRELNAKFQRIQRGVSHVIVSPSAPMHSSSPIPSPCLESNDSSNTIEFNKEPVKQASTVGIPVVNYKHSRSLSCSSLQWVHHKPPGTIDTGTVLKPKIKNGRSVKNISSGDILRPDTGRYSVVHQDADANGDVETKVYKGQIFSTVCGGAQVVLDDIETMRQVSPKGKRRAASDVNYNF